jgi:hypothetical protein
MLRQCIANELGFLHKTSASLDTPAGISPGKAIFAAPG